MAHFVKISEENQVLSIMVVADSDTQNEEGVETESVGQNFLQTHFSWPAHLWIKCSYNTFEGKHRNSDTLEFSADQSKAFRLNYASDESLKYDSTLNGFVQANKPHDSWTLNTSTGFYDAPVADPSTMSHNSVLLNPKVWDEDNQRWTALDSATNINYYWNTETNTWSNI